MLLTLKKSFKTFEASLKLVPTEDRFAFFETASRHLIEINLSLLSPREHFFECT